VEKDSFDLMTTLSISPSSKVDVHLSSVIAGKKNAPLFLAPFFSDLNIMFPVP